MKGTQIFTVDYWKFGASDVEVS
ncbi:hypothetical protein A2U01_0039258, partial [Trifolium medium]|nr:hypothetical protein [Trifolium medium]